MKIKLSFAPFLGIDKSLNHTWYEVDDNATLADLYRELPIADTYRKYLLAIVNEKHEKPEHKLEDGDKVHIYYPVAGG